MILDYLTILSILLTSSISRRFAFLHRLGSCIAATASDRQHLTPPRSSPHRTDEYRKVPSGHGQRQSLNVDLQTVLPLARRHGVYSFRQVDVVDEQTGQSTGKRADVHFARCPLCHPCARHKSEGDAASSRLGQCASTDEHACHAAARPCRYPLPEPRLYKGRIWELENVNTCEYKRNKAQPSQNTCLREASQRCTPGPDNPVRG